MTRDELLTALANVLAGLQVPRSIDGAAMLGAACKPWDQIHEAAGFGWMNAETYRDFLERTLAAG